MHNIPEDIRKYVGPQLTSLTSDISSMGVKVNVGWEEESKRSTCETLEQSPDLAFANDTREMQPDHQVHESNETIADNAFAFDTACVTLSSWNRKYLDTKETPATLDSA